MYVSYDFRIVYLSPPRTGSNSVASQLVQPPFSAVVVTNDETPHDVVWNSKYDNYTTFITVRHPYVRAVSLWRFTCYHAICKPTDRLTRSWRRVYAEGLPSFEGFLRFPFLQRAFYEAWRCSWHLERIAKPVDHIVYQERLQQDLAKIPKLKDVKLPHINGGPVNRYTWDHFYEQAPACLELVQTLWGDDFERFGYESDFEKCKAGKLFVESA